MRQHLLNTTNPIHQHVLRPQSLRQRTQQQWSPDHHGGSDAGHVARLAGRGEPAADDVRTRAVSDNGQRASRRFELDDLVEVVVPSTGMWVSDARMRGTSLILLLKCRMRGACSRVVRWLEMG
jgi:hypothetical protein